MAALLANPKFSGLAARLGIFVARRRNSAFRIGRRVIAVRHAHVEEMLCRDLDFGIGPVNREKIDEVNAGSFVLGLDRCRQLAAERQALYAALAAVDLAPLKDALERDIAAVLDSVPPGGTVEVVNGYARPLAAKTARRLFGLPNPPEPLFTDVVRSIFGHTFLNIGNDPVVRDRAVKAGRYMKTWIEEEIAARRASGNTGDDLLGLLLRQGLLDEDGVRRTIGGMLVGSIDTTATAVAKIVAAVGSDSALAEALRADAGDPVRMQGWCWDALRRWPHNPILIRQATAATTLGGCTVRPGDTVIGWIDAAMRDASAFPEPNRIRPDRDPSAYLHLGGGIHPCAGRPVNAWQIPMLVGALAARGIESVGRIGWAGGFPDQLTVTFKQGM